MPAALILVSAVGVLFFAGRLATDPAGWPTYAAGIAALVFVGARNARVIRSNRALDTMPALHPVEDEATLEAALSADRAVLYKHSTSCPVSAIVIDDVIRFARAHPDWPVYVLKVIERRALSDAVAGRLGVRHQSPQAFVLRRGQSLWHGSHSAISEQALRRHAV